jgi:hypothetical protein
MSGTLAGQMLWVVIAGLDPAIHRLSDFFDGCAGQARA